MTVKRYLVSLPERLLRSVVGLGASTLREVGQVAVPEDIRRGRLYQNLVDRQDRSLFDVSSMMAMSAVGALPDTLRWLSASAVTAAGRAGQVFAGALLDHYRTTLVDIRDTGFAAHAARQFRPYRACGRRPVRSGTPDLDGSLRRQVG